MGASSTSVSVIVNPAIRRCLRVSRVIPRSTMGARITFTVVVQRSRPAMLTLTYTLGPAPAAGATINATHRRFLVYPAGRARDRLIHSDAVDNGSPPPGAASQSFTLTANSVDPSVNVGSNITLTQGQTLSEAGSFTDPGDETWVATVNYGDSSGTNPLTLSGKTFELSHTYSTAGTDTVTVTVLASNGSIGSASFTAHVNPTSAQTTSLSTASVSGRSKVPPR